MSGQPNAPHANGPNGPNGTQGQNPITRLPPFTRIPEGVRSLADYEALAQPRMAPASWAHMNGAAGDGQTLHANRAAYAKWHILPRVLHSMQGASTALNLLGQHFAHPFLLAPVAYQRLAHPQGELASVEAAMVLGGGYIASTQASETLEDMATAARRGLGGSSGSRGAQASTGALAQVSDAVDAANAMDPPNAANSSGASGGMPWFQLYFQRKRTDTLTLLRRAEQAGYRALVITVDAPVKQRLGFVLPAGVQAMNLVGQTEPQDGVPSVADSPLFGRPLLAHAPTWADVDWLRQQTGLPIWIKGVLTAHDAQAALAHGANGLIVSNHGGRVLDGLPPTLAVLPAVLQAARDWAAAQGQPVAPVLLDGGIRRGTDAFKALCLGASAVLIGRPYIHALATAGGLGVAHAIHLLRAELELAMAIAGCQQLHAANTTMLMPA